MTLTFKIQIRGIKKPPVWRRIEIPSEFTFHDLHEAIQESFGWWDAHLYMFEKSPFDQGWTLSVPGEDDEEYGRDITDSRQSKVFDFLMQTHLTKFVYIYDFGDGWVHDITLEDISPNRELRHPLCLDGKGACPPEDCGGIHGYEDIKRLFAEEPDSEEAKECVEWMGLDSAGDFNPKEFDINEANINLSTVGKTPTPPHRHPPKSPKSLKLTDTVKKLRKDEVIKYAEDLGLVIDTTLSAKYLKEAYARAVLDNPRQVLSMLPMQDLMIIRNLKRGLDGPNIVDVYEDYFEPMLIAYGLAQAWDDGDDHYLLFGDDFRNAVTPVIDAVMDDMDVHQRVTIESYVEGLANLYGQVSHTLVKDTLVRVHQAPSLEVADHLLKQTWQHSLLLKWIELGPGIVNYGPDDNSIYCSRYGWDDPKELEDKIAMSGAAGQDYQPFKDMEIIMSARNPIPRIPNPNQEDFEAFLADKLHLNEWYVLQVCHDLWYFTMHKGEEGFRELTPGQYFAECVLEPLGVDDDLHGEALKALDAYLNHFPHWQLKGHTPPEINAVLKSTGQPLPSARRTRNIQGNASSSWPSAMPYIAPPKVGRNDPCPCGSGKKYKNCCGRGN
jgi:hypothetical protein